MFGRQRFDVDRHQSKSGWSWIKVALAVVLMALYVVLSLMAVWIIIVFIQGYDRPWAAMTTLGLGLLLLLGSAITGWKWRSVVLQSNVDEMTSAWLQALLWFVSLLLYITLGGMYLTETFTRTA